MLLEQIISDDMIIKFMHLSKMGVAPKIIDAYPCIDENTNHKYRVLLQEVEGITLNEYIRQKLENEETEELQETFQRLGRKVRIMREEDIIHNDLHAGNIIVEEKYGIDPVIIDWYNEKKNIREYKNKSDEHPDIEHILTACQIKVINYYGTHAEKADKVWKILEDAFNKGYGYY